MGRTVVVTLYCANHLGEKSKVTFEERSPEKWYGISSEPVSKVMKRPPQSTGKPSFFGSLFGFRPKNEQPAPEPQETSEVAEMRGTFWMDKATCPFCGNKNYVKCNTCHHLTCYDDSGTFTCSYCGNGGRVTGHVSSLSGEVNRPNGDTRGGGNNPPRGGGPSTGLRR